MNGKINSVYGGGLVHTLRIEKRPIQTWIFDEQEMDHTANGSLISEIIE